ncbi:hypothetical protein BMT89_15840 [Escherichia coli]|nr:hypothetical protein BMT89_15840 [Escherichia coli]
MDSIHGHEVLNMMIESGEQYTHASLEAAIKARFGEQARFHTCSAEGMKYLLPRQLRSHGPGE